MGSKNGTSDFSACKMAVRFSKTDYFPFSVSVMSDMHTFWMTFWQGHLLGGIIDNFWYWSTSKLNFDVQEIHK